MKTLIITTLLTSMVLLGEEPPKRLAAERPITKEESLTLQLTQSRILRLRDRYKIDEFEAEAKAIIAEQRAIFNAACRSIGIPDEKIDSECRLNTGVDADGKPVMGQDGKPVEAKVWREEKQITIEAKKETPK